MEYEGYLNLFLSHLDELRLRLLRILKVFFIFFAIFLIFDLRTVSFLGFNFPFLYPDFFHNIGAQFFTAIEHHVLTKGYVTITLNPTDGVVADFYSAMFLGFAMTLPLTIDQIGKFVSPGLKANESQALRSVVVPGSLLFILGSFVGIYFFLPDLFRIFYLYDVGLGAVPDLSISKLVSFVFIYTLIFGLSFEVPVFMVMLSRFGVISASYWKEKWRYAVVGALLFGLILSPGVTGFTMMAMAIPMILLYFAGIYFARKAELKYSTEKETVVDA